MQRRLRRPTAVALSRALLPLALVAAAVLAYEFLWRARHHPLVVYCAHDAVYSEAVLRSFEQRTGIPVSVKFDTEATKSLGLVELLAREKDAPRCDVFWNNEVLGTVYLKEQGVLDAYKGPGYERIPIAFKDPEGCWAGFGARLRVYIVNTEQLAATPEAVEGALAGDLSHVAIAKPLYGTTLTQYTALWSLWGGEKLKAWHEDWRRRGVQEATGNAHVRELVARGTCKLGLTDSDDFFLVRDAGRPVAAVPVRVGAGQVICIPNTVAIIKGTRRMEEARRLADYLLSEECELVLAASSSRQVPLGPVDEQRLPPDVREMRRWAAEPLPLGELGPARAACLAWLKEVYLQ